MGSEAVERLDGNRQHRGGVQPQSRRAATARIHIRHRRSGGAATALRHSAPQFQLVRGERFRPRINEFRTPRPDSGWRLRQYGRTQPLPQGYGGIG